MLVSCIMVLFGLEFELVVGYLCVVCIGLFVVVVGMIGSGDDIVV